MYRFFASHKKTFFAAAFLVLFSVTVSFATPDANTLDPDCAPTDPGCFPVLSGGGAATWSSITGTLSSNTDLQAALDAKENTLTFSTGLTRSTNTITNNLSTGVSGGQSVIGGTASGNNLILSSTSNATKGKILFGTSAYDEVNNRLGIGVANPTRKFDISTNSGGSVMSVENTSTTGYSAISFKDTGSNAVVDIGYGNSGLSAPFGNSAYFRTNNTIPIILVTANNERFRITSTGEVGINTSSPLAQLDINGSAILSGTSRYLNFNSTSGVSGYGLRDNDGTVEFKNNSGTWQAPLSGTGTSGQIAFWNGAGTQTSSSAFLWDNTQKSLSVRDLNNTIQTRIVGSLLQFGTVVSPTLGQINYDTDAAGFYITTNGHTSVFNSSGGLSINSTSQDHALDVNGNIGIATGGYLHFSGIDGALGYGIRDNAGTIQYKNSGGSWTSFSSGGGSMAIGSAVGSGVNKNILFIDSSGNLAQDDGFQYDSDTKSFVFGLTDTGGTILTGNTGAFARGIAQGGGHINASELGSVAWGISNNSNITAGGVASFVFGSADNDGLLNASNNSSFVFGGAYSGSIITNGEGSLAFGVANGGQIRTDSQASLAFGTVDSLLASQIYTGGDNSFAFGSVVGGASLYTDGGGAFTSGYAGGDDGNGTFSYIRSATSATTHGYASGGAYINAAGQASLIHGTVDGSDGNSNVSYLFAGESAQVFGTAFTGAYMSASDRSLVFGTAQGADVNGNLSYITTGSDAGLAWGTAFNGGYINTSGSASQTFGYTDGADINGNVSYLQTDGSGSFTFGNATSAGHISNTGDGSFAHGLVNDSGSIVAGGGGSTAGGTSIANGLITTAAQGSFAYGYVDSGAINAGADGVLVGGYAAGGYAISSTGSGSFVFGDATDGDIINAGIGSIVVGGILENNSNYGGIFGQYGTIDINSNNSFLFALGGATTTLSTPNTFAVGYDGALLLRLSGTSVFLGSQAGFEISESQGSNFIGPAAGYQALGVTDSNFLGSSAGLQADGSANANFFGRQAGYQSASAAYSNFFGYEAGRLAAGSSRSNFFGYQAGYQVSSPYSNLFGYQVGKTFTSNSIGSNNIIIGTNISLPDATANAINIGGVLFGTGTYSTSIGDPSVTAVTSGKIGIAKVTPAYTLDVGNSSISGIVAQFTNSTGSCTINPTTTSLSCSSDRNLKKNIQPLSSSLATILSLAPVSYNWNTESSIDTAHAGFIAQDIEAIIPGLVSTDSATGLKAVNYIGFIPYTVKAIQELDIKIDTIIPEAVDTTAYGKIKEFLRGIAAESKAVIDIVIAKKVQTQELCIGDTADSVCVTREQLRSLLQYANSQGSSAPEVPAPAPIADPIEIAPIPASADEAPAVDPLVDPALELAN